MRIEGFVRNSVPLSEEEQKVALDKQAELETRFPGIDVSTYMKLLPVMKAASRAEQPDKSPSQQIQIAYEHAAKLAVVFGDFDKAIAYLAHYEQRYPDERQNVHDACLFSLPEGKCDMAMWRNIVAKNSPTSPQDAILRILPFAEKIESYVNNNREKLVQSIRDEVTSEFELQISQKFDVLPVKESKEAWIEKQLATKQKLINKNTEAAFDTYLRGQLGLPSGKQVKLDENQRKLAKELRSRLNKPTSEEDLKKYSEIKTEQTGKRPLI